MRFLVHMDMKICLIFIVWKSSSTKSVENSKWCSNQMFYLTVSQLVQRLEDDLSFSINIYEFHKYFSFFYRGLDVVVFLLQVSFTKFGCCFFVKFQEFLGRELSGFDEVLGNKQWKYKHELITQIISTEAVGERTRQIGGSLRIIAKQVG